MSRCVDRMVQWSFCTRVVATLSVAALVNIFPVTAEAAGDDNCRCIDPADRGMTGANDTPLNFTASLCPLKHNGTCYSSTYGADSCLTHDETHTPACRSPSPPPWCKYSWCYVDAKACERPFQTSRFFPDIKVDNTPLSYSYATCGSLDYFLRSDEELRRLNRKVRISFPNGTSGTGYTMMRVSDEEEGFKDSAGTDTRMTGSFVHFMNDLFAFYGIEWIVTPISEESEQYADRWTNCIHEVAINRTDMCWSDFWMTESRLFLSNMMIMYPVDFKIMVRKQTRKEATFSSMLEVPFMPFTWPLWSVIIAQ